MGAKEVWLEALRRETPESDTASEGSEEGLDPSWIAALRFAEEMNESGHSVDDRTYAELSQYWNESEILEITLVVGLFAYFNRVNDALRVDITK